MGAVAGGHTTLLLGTQGRGGVGVGSGGGGGGVQDRTIEVPVGTDETMTVQRGSTLIVMGAANAGVIPQSAPHSIKRLIFIYAPL